MVCLFDFVISEKFHFKNRGLFSLLHLILYLTSKQKSMFYSEVNLLNGSWQTKHKLVEKTLSKHYAFSCSCSALNFSFFFVVVGYALFELQQYNV